MEQILEIADSIVTAGNRAFVAPELITAVDTVLNSHYSVENWKKNKDVIRRLAIAYDKIRRRYDPERYTDDIPYMWAAYYMAPNTYKAQDVLSRTLRCMNSIPREMYVIDLGSGVGATVWGVTDYLRIISNLCHIYGLDPFYDMIEVRSYEYAAENINVFEEIRQQYVPEEIRGLSVKQPVKLEVGTPGWVSDLPDDKPAIVFFSNMLSELQDDDSRKEVVKECMDAIHHDSVLCIIEPADKKRSVALRKLQARLVNEAGLNVWGPCGLLAKTNHAPRACATCWSFARQNLNQSDGMKLIEKALAVQFPGAGYDADLAPDRYDNARLRWSWSIISRNKPRQVFRVSDYYNGETATLAAACNNSSTNPLLAEVVGSITKTQRPDNIIKYTLCDQSRPQQTLLDVSDVDPPRLRTGDVVLITDYDFDGSELTARNNTLFQVLKPVGPDKLVAEPKDSLRMQDACKFFMHRFWGFESFRPKQFDILRRALLKKNVIGILPTGIGKSLCFQLPAFLSQGTAIVISPLRSLMDDQIDNLKKKGFDHGGYIDAIHGRLSPKLRDAVLRRFAAGQLKILYIAPERFRMRSFTDQLQKLLAHQGVSYLVIDEAHCISEWGHDFRASYLQLRLKCRRIGDPPIIALTATASQDVRKDICKLLEIVDDEDHVITSTTLSRPEISMEVILADRNERKEAVLNALLSSKRQDGVRPIHDVIGYNSRDEMLKDNSGLVFCAYGKKTYNHAGQPSKTAPFSAEHVSYFLSSQGHSTKYYFAKLPDDRQSDIQRNFKEDQFPILVSTKGFGMGIDKPNIDFVVHFVAPGSLEGLYQEGGRAGRDKKHAHNVLVYTPPCNVESGDGHTCHSYRSANHGVPRCMHDKENSRKYWRCFYDANQTHCDYGRQARFIEDNIPDRDDVFHRYIHTYKFLARREKNYVVQCCMPTEHRYGTTDDGVENYGSNWFEQSMFYFVEHGLVEEKSIDVIDYKNINGELCETFEVRLTRKFEGANINSIANTIADKYRDIKRQRYWMLNALDLYAKGDPALYTHADSGSGQAGRDMAVRPCRRNLIMAHFQEENLDLSKPCGFCDLCGEIPSGHDARAQTAEATGTQQQMFSLFHSLTETPEPLFNQSDMSNMLRLAYKGDLILILQQRALAGLTEEQRHPVLMLINAFCELIATGNFVQGTWEEAFQVVQSHPRTDLDQFRHNVIEIAEFIASKKSRARIASAFDETLISLFMESQHKYREFADVTRDCLLSVRRD